MALKLGYKDLIADAMSKIDTLNLEQAKALLDDPETLFVDIRDVRELEREGMIPNAFHAPRGMLEFWVDPDSPYYTIERARALYQLGRALEALALLHVVTRQAQDVRAFEL